RAISNILKTLVVRLPPQGGLAAPVPVVEFRNKAALPGIILISSIRLYLPAALLVPGRAEVVLDQGGGAGNERRKIRAVTPLLDSLRCRVLGGRKTQMGKRPRADNLLVLPCPGPDCRRH